MPWYVYIRINTYTSTAAILSKLFHKLIAHTNYILGAIASLQKIYGCMPTATVASVATCNLHAAVILTIVLASSSPCPHVLIGRV
jgi:hypothetical protein